MIYICKMNLNLVQTKWTVVTFLVKSCMASETFIILISLANVACSNNIKNHFVGTEQRFFFSFFLGLSFDIRRDDIRSIKKEFHISFRLSHNERALSLKLISSNAFDLDHVRDYFSQYILAISVVAQFKQFINVSG